METFIAHIREKDKYIQTVEEHLLEVSKLCGFFAGKIKLQKSGELVGLLHDFGKFSKVFQKYIRSGGGLFDQDSDDYINPISQKGKIDHSTAGAQVVWERFPKFSKIYPLYAQILALSISGHHSGLYDCLSESGERTFLSRMKKEDVKTFRMECLESADKNILERLESLLNKALVQELSDKYQHISRRNQTMMQCAQTDSEKADMHHFVYLQLGLLTRFLLSCLIDADRINSAEFEYPEYKTLRSEMKYPDWGHLSEKLEKALDKLNENTPVNQSRALVSQACMQCAKSPKGIYTLTVPTGGGKTLSSLRFALNHANEHTMDRIVYIIPYTSIIDQNAKTAREILEAEKPVGSVVLEHHSNILPENDTWQSRMLATNWESPVVFTTMVQFLDACFSKGTRSMRHLHSLANSVIIFDEIQTLPIHCTHLFCHALNFLVEECGASAVLCTATQPLLGNLPSPFKGQLQLAPEREMMPDIHGLFQNMRRVRFINHCRTPFTEEAIVDLALDELEKSGSCLVIANTKSWAERLYKACCRKTSSRVIYLSTSLCPAHRVHLLDEIRPMLLPSSKEPLLCISTQLIECGVDISFGAVVRFAAGLDSILQAAGRCNRHGKGDDLGRVHIVTPREPEPLRNLPDIYLGKDVFLRMMNEAGCPMQNDDADLTQPDLIRQYFTDYLCRQASQMDYPAKPYPLLFLLGDNRQNPGYDETHSYMLQQSFGLAGKLFTPIDAPTEGIIVPYGERGKDVISELCSLSGRNYAGELLREAQRYTVNVFPNVEKRLPKYSLHVIPELGVRYLSPGYYDQALGLVTEFTGELDTLYYGD